MKRVIYLLIYLIFVFLLTPFSIAADSGLTNFHKVNEYTDGKFTDVDSGSWYSENVKIAYELGLMNGNSDTTFNPAGNITIAETIALACRLHSIYTNGKVDFKQGNLWYQVYVDYAMNNGIIKTNEYPNYAASATRMQFTSIIATAIPKSALKEINIVEDNAIPDVDLIAQHADDIYMLYRAGILSGNDKTGIFTPNANIQRSAVATIVARMVNESLRQSFILTRSPINSYLQIDNDKGSYSIIHEDEQLFLTADFGSGNIANKDIEWSSSDVDIATVNDGLVCGKSAGRAEITASYNGVSAKCIVLVASKDGKPIYAGTMAIKKDGILYKSNVPKYTWLDKIKYLDDSPTIYVYTINGEYYINNSLLHNLAHCYYGETVTVKSDNPFITDLQLCGSANLDEREEWNTDYISATEEIQTRTIYVTLPNKNTISYDFDSLIYSNGKKTDTIVYNVHYSDNEVVSNGFFYMQSIPEYLKVMEIDCNWYFDSDTKQLVFELD